MLELLLKEDEWAASDQALLEKVRNCGHAFTHSECSNRECHILARSILDEVIYETRFLLYFLYYSIHIEYWCVLILPTCAFSVLKIRR